MERAEPTKTPRLVRSDRHVVVGLRVGELADMADVLLAADLAARLGARLVLIATMDRWSRWARWTAGVYCAFGVETVVCAARVAEQETRDELEHRLRSLLDLVGVEWTLEWAAGSSRRAAVRYTRRHPDATVILRPHRQR
ncbi:hypothetical protein [Frankia sp. AgKG'84/4]|uniref:hypothetical protein n=1 Tax=Frankia sp. AgKG'84/4 TaxID=573490 RepID=UPI00200F3C1A|nr:hypothetical protein [Frankia sp. AgKG'84/4]MCL9796374.1 hypothetical protein [Frankia sp. AgKG'84/4]